MCKIFIGSLEFSKVFNSKFDPRGPGDIEIGPDPSFQCPVNIAVAPHPEKCDYYYTCYPGYPVTLWKCYSDYLFDLKYFGCNFPAEVDCGNRQRPDPSEFRIAFTYVYTTFVLSLLLIDWCLSFKYRV